jgi:DnaK suppressor protein
MTTNRKDLLLSLLSSLQAGELPSEGLAVQKTGDFVDEASRLSEQAVTTELLRHRVESLRKIKKALGRFEGPLPSPDLCENCEEEIGEKRLGAVPWATLCVRCQTREERSGRDVDEGKRVKAHYASVYRTKKIMMPSDYYQYGKKEKKEGENK